MQFKLLPAFLEWDSFVPMLYSTAFLNLGLPINNLDPFRPWHGGPELSKREHMDAFEIADLIAQHQQKGQPYHEFFRTETLSLGLYVLQAGEQDPQGPHTEEEVYYIFGRSGHDSGCR